MKKYRIFSGFLSLLILVGAMMPVTVAFASGHQEPITYLVEGTGDAKSELFDEMHIQATAAVLWDDTNKVFLYEQDAGERRYPASITKVMTALLTIEAVERGELAWDQIIVGGDELYHEVGAWSSTQNIKEGEEMPLLDVLYCALTASANESCNMLAQAVAGTVANFVAMMNQRAQELGMYNTNFRNTHGYHNDDHFTTAYDIVTMCSEAMSHSIFREIVGSPNYLVPATNMSDERMLRETNALISNFRITGYLYSAATGIKTGSTTQAGLCLASAATKNGRDLIAVVLGCVREEGATGSEGYTQFAESKRLLEWGFNSMDIRSVMDPTGYHFEVPVILSNQANYIGLEPVGELSAMIPADLDINQFRREVVLYQDEVKAPVSKGDVLGSITVTNDGVEYGQLDLVAVAKVDRSDFLFFLYQIQWFFGLFVVRLLSVVLVVLGVITWLKWFFFGKRRRRRTYSGRKRR